MIIIIVINYNYYNHYDNHNVLSLKFTNLGLFWDTYNCHSDLVLFCYNFILAVQTRVKSQLRVAEDFMPQRVRCHARSAL